MYWLPIIIASLGTFVLKWLGYLIPARHLDHPRVQFLVGLLPVGLLAGLIVQQTLTTANQIVIDGRLLGAVIAVIASARKLPFIAIIFLAAISTAIARYFGLVA